MAVALIMPQLRSMIVAQPRGDKDMTTGQEKYTGLGVYTPDYVSWCYHQCAGNRLPLKCQIGQCYECHEYELGDCLPNYPVPAIRLEVDICQTWADAVVIFNRDDGVIAYIHGDMS